MAKIDDPCYECDKRKVGCHSTCEPYLKWSDGVRELHAAIQKEKIAAAIVARHGIDNHRRNIKKQHAK